jgi:hypothetical protein
MDSLFDQTKEYTVQPGCRYAIAYAGNIAGAGNLVVGWPDPEDHTNPFTLADGSTTVDPDIIGLGHSGGWEVLAVTNKIRATVTGYAYVTLVRVEN